MVQQVVTPETPEGAPGETVDIDAVETPEGAAEVKVIAKKVAVEGKALGESSGIKSLVVNLMSDDTAVIVKLVANGEIVVIPDTIEVDGREYAVTTLKKSAFKDDANKKVTTVVIGKNITKIEGHQEASRFYCRELYRGHVQQADLRIC